MQYNEGVPWTNHDNQWELNIPEDKQGWSAPTVICDAYAYNVWATSHLFTIIMDILRDDHGKHLLHLFSVC